MGIVSWTATELGRKIQEKEITAEEAVMAAFDQIKALEPSLNAYVSLDEEGA